MTCQVQTVNMIGKVHRIIMVLENPVHNLVSYTLYKKTKGQEYKIAANIISHSCYKIGIQSIDLLK